LSTRTKPITPLDHLIDAVVRPPGSKSITNRALLCAALAAGVSRLHGGLEADDTQAMRRGLEGLGVVLDDVDDPWLVEGRRGQLAPTTALVDARDSGTTARFLTAAAALAGGEVTVDGSPRLRERPIQELVDALVSWGVGAETLGRAGCPPVRVRGSSVQWGGEVEVDAHRSSQFLSALLMVAPYAPVPVRIHPVGGVVVSRPYLRTTLEVMKAFSMLVVEEPDGSFVVPSGMYQATQLDIEADASAAVYPLVAAAVTGGSVVITGIPESSTQADLAILDVLAGMGCSVRKGPDAIGLEAPAGKLAAVDVDMSDAPDGSMAVAVAALFAEEPSRLRGLSTLRLKETDRLVALQNEIRRLGAGAEVDGDHLTVVPGRLRPTIIETYNDHRMAMAFAVVGLAHPGIEIADPGCVQKTWPDYFDMLAGL